jgi:hypothetical protein
MAPKEKGPKRSKRLRISGPYIPYGLFQTEGETCAKFGSDRFKNVNLYKFHTCKQRKKETNKHSSLYIRKICTMPVCTHHTWPPSIFFLHPWQPQPLCTYRSQAPLSIAFVLSATCAGLASFVAKNACHIILHMTHFFLYNC